MYNNVYHINVIGFDKAGEFNYRKNKELIIVCLNRILELSITENNFNKDGDCLSIKIE